MRLFFYAVIIQFIVSAQDKVDFLKEVQPVLTSRCLACHSGEGAQAGLKVHTRNDLTQGGKSGPAIVPGQGRDSLLISKMQGRKGLRMPPSGPPIDAATIERIRLWVDEGAQFSGTAAVSGRIAPLAPRTPPIPAGNATNPIDRFLNRQTTKLASDSLFARRSWLDITGLLPTPEELRAFEQDKAPDKRERAIDALLARRQDYAGHWISFWNDLLRNDEGVIYHGERKSITEWLLTSLEKNTPYDAMVRALLDPPTDGPEGFLTGVTWRGVVSASQTPPMQAAQNAAQVFLGMNIKCAACHDSFINRWKLSDTYGLASLFSDQPLELVRCDVKLGKMAEARFPIGDLKVSFGDTLASRRAAAAEWFTHPANGRFARTLVNRYWRKLLGRGLVEPADDMDAESSNPDLLDWLASDFAAHNFDLQHLLKRIMTSHAYQTDRPLPRRLSAEQFADAISAVTGEWRVSTKRTETYSSYVREWRLKSDPLSRALGRPIRDQVYTERSADASTLQALELMNGPLLSKRLERGARALLGEQPPAPMNLFDSKVVRSGKVPVDIDITGAKELWLVIEDVDSYDPARVIARWTGAELIGPHGAVKLEALPETIPSSHHRDLTGKGFTRFRAEASIDEKSRQSDINPAVRFFVFTQKPDPDQLIRVQGERPSVPLRKQWTSDQLAERLYIHLFSRAPSPAERRIAREMLGADRPSASGVEDLLWAMLMSPEFQYIR